MNRNRIVFFVLFASVLLILPVYSQQLSSDDSAPSDLSQLEQLASQEKVQQMLDATTRLGKCEEPKSMLDVFGLSYLALIVVILLYTAAYLAGKLFNYPITDAMLRIKIDEVITTLFIILGVSFLYSFVNQSGGYYYLNEAIEYNQKVLGHVLRDIGIFTVFSTIIYLLYGLTIYIPIIPGMPLIKFTISIGPALKPLADTIFQSSNMLGVVVIEWTTMYAILCMIKTWWLSLILPLGVLLRSLSITKDAGNTLIALAIGMYFLYPILLTMNYDIYETGVGKAVALGITNFDILLDLLKTPFLGLPLSTTGVISVLILSFLLFFTRGAAFIVAVIVGLVWLLQNTLIEVLFLLLIISLFLPALNVFITLTFIMELGKLLGTDINVSALTKMI